MTRSRFFFSLFFILFIFYCMRFAYLQVIQGGSYKNLADENAARTNPILAQRGIVFDRSDKIMVKNRPIFSVYIIPHYTKSLKRKEIFARLGSIFSVSKEEIERRYLEKKSTIFEGVLIAADVPLSIVSKIEEEKKDLPGVEVICYPMRSYPYPGYAAHVLGYIAEISPKELELLSSRGYRLGDLIGKDGVEKIYDGQLRGISGGKRYQVDAFGRPVKIEKIIEPVIGKNMKLTIDLELQEAVEKALGAKEGAVVVLNPNNGEILAMASHPNYYAGKKWEETSQYLHPFMNRAISGYPPGSIFKIVTLSAALEEKKVNASELFYCPGYYRIGKRIAKCWLESGHGRLSAIEGLVWSCDVVFYELGRRLGPDLINKYAKLYGLGEKTNIDLTQEKRGFVPTSAWKKTRFNENWFEGDSINLGIGQGFTQVTPLQMALAYGMVATGKRYKPYVVKEIFGEDGKKSYSAKPEIVAELPEDLRIKITDALHNVVLRGTGVAAFIPGFEAAGKTGTAQNPGLPHAWFVCFAPYDKPEIVIASFVAHGQHGDQVTAYIARDVLRWYKENRFTGTSEKKERPGQYIMHGAQKTPYGVRKKSKNEAEEDLTTEEE
ncbi:MAG: mrdA [Candidatus Saganbacteria bacterium]|uniref:MrdA n=1 Tax=Candidatus Saganbacteria bacterium TaxID=2575572 RepID=A0A833L0G5_UNCSA|nr:MAG: mrdA [Candidatus Saganbacteria bacterium]